MIRRVLGSMTGTSCDGLDLALLEIRGSKVGLVANFLNGSQHDLGDLGPRLRELTQGQPITMEDYTRLMRDFSAFHVKCIRNAGYTNLDLVVLHGQTLHHAPPLSLQMVNLSQVAAELDLPVLGDLRGVDLARGGQGAPITPLADDIFYGCPEEKRVVLNLGGFCNLTYLPKKGDWNGIRGFDVCTTNLLLDLLAREVLGKSYDRGGEGALQGDVLPELREDLEGRLLQQFDKGASLGQKDLPSIKWFQGYPLSYDLLKTSCQAIARVIGKAILKMNPDRLLVAGGGALNPVLLEGISSYTSLIPEGCGTYGPPSEFREASSIALLGALSQDRVPITLPAVTGTRDSFISGLYLDPRTPS